jgi:general secretion pathway protein L
LDAALSRELALPVKRLELPLEASGHIEPTTQGVAAQAYALALRGQATGPKAPRFNLRRGEYAFKGDYDYVKERTGTLAIFGAVFFVLLIATGIVRGSVLNRRERQLDAMLCETTQRITGQCVKNWDVALSMLRGKESPTAAIPKQTAVKLLAELTQRLPEVPLTVDQIEIELDRITLNHCVTDSTKQIDKLVTALKAYKCFKDVKEGRVEKTKDGQKVTFRLEIQVECPETSEGQG